MGYQPKGTLGPPPRPQRRGKGRCAWCGGDYPVVVSDDCPRCGAPRPQTPLMNYLKQPGVSYMEGDGELVAVHPEPPDPMQPDYAVR
jgi:hypothetical protein